MTTPTERAAAVLRTREFLEMLACPENDTVPPEIPSRAKTLLRHYPFDYEIELTCAALPMCWQMPGRHGNVWDAR